MPGFLSLFVRLKCECIMDVNCCIHYSGKDYGWHFFDIFFYNTTAKLCNFTNLKHLKVYLFV